MDIITVYRALAAVGLLGLIILIVAWNAWFAPVQQFPRAIEILLLAGPLLFFTRGILHGRRYTFVIITMVSFAYLLMGVWYILSVQEKLYGYFILLFSFAMFIGSLLYVWVIDKREKLAFPERFSKKSKMSRK